MQVHEESKPTESPTDAAESAMVDLRLSLTGTAGTPLRQTWPASREENNPSASLEQIAEAAQGALGLAGSFLVSGDNFIERPDFAEVIRTLAAIRPHNFGIWLPGDGLDENLIRRMSDLGVTRVCIPFHSARRDAHDWLVRRRGSLKAAHSALRACVSAGMPVSAEITVTRANAAHLAESVEVLSRIGVGSIAMRRLRESDVGATDFVPLSPRLSLIEKELEHAAVTSLRRKTMLVLRDFPLCTAPRLAKLLAPRGSERWLYPTSETVTTAQRYERTGVTGAADPAGCEECPGAPVCAGAPIDYVARFGWDELAESAIGELRLSESVKRQQAAATSVPIVFSWRSPRRIRCDACTEGSGGKLTHGSRDQGEEMARRIRAHLVAAAKYRPQRLRLVGADLLSHSKAASLIFDAVRLFPAVEVACEASPVIEWSNLELRRLRGLHRFDIAFYGADAPRHDAHCGIPGAFAAAMEAAERLRGEEIEVGAYAIIHNAEDVADFADAWQSKTLPGTPRFRLSQRGGDIDDLIECLHRLAAGPAHEALAKLLPQCELARRGFNIAAEATDRTHEIDPDRFPMRSIRDGRSSECRPSGSDPIGAFSQCDVNECVAAGCPGLAHGWQYTQRTNQWNKSR